MPPLPDLASLCEYPAGLNGSAARFERPCAGDTATNNNSDPAPPCPSATRAHDRRRAAAAEATQEEVEEEVEEEERPTPPTGRVTRSRAGRNGRRSDGKCAYDWFFALPSFVFSWAVTSGDDRPDTLGSKIDWTRWHLYGVRRLVSQGHKGGISRLFCGPRHDRRRGAIWRRGVRSVDPRNGDIRCSTASSTYFDRHIASCPHAGHRRPLA